MSISAFDLFSIGVGPSSSHTVGPMRAAYKFLELLKSNKQLTNVKTIKIELYGSLALTGIGHGTDYAVILGLEGELPETIDPDLSRQRFIEIQQSKKLNLSKEIIINFDYKQDLIFHYDETLPFHPNGLCFTAISKNQELICSKNYYSVGGGFVVEQDGFNKLDKKIEDLPYPFESSHELLTHCEALNCSIAQVMFKNELTWRSENQIKEDLKKIWLVMEHSIEQGKVNDGILPGGLKVPRRAPKLYQKMLASNETNEMDWLSLYAIAVNEENAAGGKVVTAPTNGAAGTIPSVLNHYLSTKSKDKDNDLVEFLLTAAAIGILYKKGASISAAEVGCQGEVGVACSMAAAALAAVLGGNIYQIENAAEIGMEHHLGLTCDPIGGLVQIPCIERNAMGAVQAVNAARLALLGDGKHHVSLDKVIATMWDTGRDMMSKYKETALGGLAVNVPEC